MYIPLSILEHFNYFGIDENLGPVAISLKREKNEESIKLNNLPLLSPPKVQYRFIVRTGEVSLLWSMMEREGWVTSLLVLCDYGVKGEGGVVVLVIM